MIGKSIEIDSLKSPSYLAVSWNYYLKHLLLKHIHHICVGVDGQQGYWESTDYYSSNMPPETNFCS